EDPDLHAADTISGLRFCRAVVNIGAQRVKRNATFTVPFQASDFRATQTTRAVDTDTFGSKTHCRLNGTLHGATECHTAFELLSDRLGDQTSADFLRAAIKDVEQRVGVSL